ncbi:MAG: C-type lectin domain-containing protein [Cyanobium sp.]
MNFPTRIPTRHALAAAMSTAVLFGGAAFATPTYTLISSGSLNRSTYEVWMRDSVLTWSEASNYANNTLKARLVSINSVTENDFVASLIGDPRLYTNAWPGGPTSEYLGPYIGLKRNGPTTGVVNPNVGWQWVDGTSLTQSDPLWNLWFNVGNPGGQPDAMHGDNVALYYNTTASNVTTWGDVYDGATFLPQYGGGSNMFLANSFVIEKVPGPVPLMAAFAAFRWSRQLRRRHNRADGVS